MHSSEADMISNRIEADRMAVLTLEFKRLFWLGLVAQATPGCHFLISGYFAPAGHALLFSRASKRLNVTRSAWRGGQSRS